MRSVISTWPLGRFQLPTPENKMIPKGAKYVSNTGLYYKFDNGVFRFYADTHKKWLPVSITKKGVTRFLKNGVWKKLDAN